MQVGGGITDENCEEWIEAGASKVRVLCCVSFTGRSMQILIALLQVIVTSYLFPDARFSLERLKRISSLVGKDRLVVDVRSVSPLLVPEHVRALNVFSAAGGAPINGS